MKKFKVIITVLLVVFVLSSFGYTKTKPEPVPSTTADLKYQIKKEMVDVLTSEVTLYFQGKFLTGVSYITLTVDDNGKIMLKSVSGENNILNAMIERKFSTCNLWTDTKFQGEDFTFKIVSK